MLAKEETVLQGMVGSLTETGKRYGMAMDVEKTKGMRVSRQPSPIKIRIDQKQLENVECFSYLASKVTNGARCTRRSKFRFVVAEQHSTRSRISSPANWPGIQGRH
jgi:hypothetical protein